MENSELINKVRKNALEFKDGEWWLLQMVETTEIRKNYDYEAEYEEIEEFSQMKKKRTLNLTAYKNEVWFQLSVAEKDVSLLKNFDNVLPNVWKVILLKDGSLIRYIKNQTREMQEYVKSQNLENIIFFNPLCEDDAKLLCYVDGISLKLGAEKSVFSKKGEKYECLVPLDGYKSKEFFYEIAFEKNAGGTAEYLWRSVLQGNQTALNFMLVHTDSVFIRRNLVRIAKKVGGFAKEHVLRNGEYEEFWIGIIEMAEKNDSDAIRVVLQNCCKPNALDCLAKIAHEEKSSYFNSAKNIVFQHPENEDCWLVILEKAQQGNESAQAVVFMNLDKKGAFECISELAKSQNDVAMEVVLQHPEVKACWLVILEKAQQGNESAQAVVFTNLDKKGAFECVTELAKSQNDAAMEVVLQHPEREDCWSVILENAQQGKESAQTVVLANLDKKGAFECVAEMAKSQNEAAMDVILLHPERGDCWSVILENAQQGKESAQAVVLANLDKEGAFECVTEMAKSQNDAAMEVVLQHPEREDCWSVILENAQQGKESAQTVVLANLDKKGAIECVAEMAKLQNDAAMNVVLLHPEVENCWSVILEKALRGDESALSVVLANIDSPQALECVVDLAKRGCKNVRQFLFNQMNNTTCLNGVLELADSEDEEAIDWVLENVEKKQCLYKIRELALKKNEKAVAFVLKDNNLRDSGGLLTAIKLAELGCQAALDCMKNIQRLVRLFSKLKSSAILAELRNYRDYDSVCEMRIMRLSC